jgi:metal-responsive CopG/Arc/MetJ family transcriptional regulator
MRGILLYMKAIQITMDESLLARLDADEEVRRLGRSAVLRRAVEEYLRRRRAAGIADAYRRAYREGGGAGPE